MANPIDKENLRAVFNKIMQSHQLKPQDVKKERSQIAVSDNGQFLCENCVNKWRSNFSWVTFDLIDLEIVYRWKMKCRVCMLPWIPTFTVPQLESMYENVICYYKGENRDREIDIGYKGRRAFRQPHRPDLCEKCQWGIEECWRRKFYG